MFCNVQLGQLFSNRIRPLNFDWGENDLPALNRNLKVLHWAKRFSHTQR
ncbi:hypothetical protein VB780_27675 [Leptolyngbya sp. CCNP1308]|nr:hypothetical protein [Leptolyngbya sp. CCNP1308]